MYVRFVQRRRVYKTVRRVQVLGPFTQVRVVPDEIIVTDSQGTRTLAEAASMDGISRWALHSDWNDIYDDAFVLADTE